MKTIFFDFGNVVGFFDHQRTLAKLQPFTDWKAADMYQSVYQGELEDLFERGGIAEDAFLQRVHELWQLRCDLGALRRAIGDIFWPNPEVCALIPKLAGRYRLVLGSNTNAIHSAQFLDQFADVLRPFDALVLSHEIRARKPEPAFFQHCHRQAGAAEADCVFIDDLAENIAGARAIGLAGIVYRPNDDLAGKLHALGVEV